MAGFVDWAAAHPGRMTHPDPSNFMGATFLKQALIELAPDAAVLQAPVTDAAFDAATAPLWAWYDALRPNLWRQGADLPGKPVGAATIAERWRGGYRDVLRPRLDSRRDCAGAVAGNRAGVRAQGRQHRQYQLCRHSLQRRPCSRGRGGGELPARPRDAGAYAEYRGSGQSFSVLDPARLDDAAHRRPLRPCPPPLPCLPWPILARPCWSPMPAG